jgi:hypothetical protein
MACRIYLRTCEDFIETVNPSVQMFIEIIDAFSKLLLNHTDFFPAKSCCQRESFAMSELRFSFEPAGTSVRSSYS